MRVLITGASGRLASIVKNDVRFQEFQLAFSSHKRRDFSILLNSLSSPMEFQRALTAVDVVLHLGSVNSNQGDRADYFSGNVLFTTRLYYNCMKFGVKKFIFLSTAVNPKLFQLTPLGFFSSMRLYSRSKHLAEENLTILENGDITKLVIIRSGRIMQLSPNVSDGALRYYKMARRLVGGWIANNTSIEEISQEILSFLHD